MHQFTHIIGFIRSILGDKVKPTTVKRINKMEMEKEMIIGDNLIGFARKYFNCNIIDCLEIMIEEFEPNLNHIYSIKLHYPLIFYKYQSIYILIFNINLFD